jgi:hypothetical protein
MLVRRDCFQLSFIRLAVENAVVKHDLTAKIGRLTAGRARSDSSTQKFSLNYKALLHRVTRATQAPAFSRAHAEFIHRIIEAAAKSSDSPRDAHVFVARFHLHNETSGLQRENQCC